MIKLDDKRVLVTGYKFSCSDGKDIKFLLKDEFGSFCNWPELVPEEGHAKIFVADLIAICEEVRKDYGKCFRLAYDGVDLFIDTNTDIKKRIIEELKV